MWIMGNELRQFLFCRHKVGPGMSNSDVPKDNVKYILKIQEGMVVASCAESHNLCTEFSV